VTDWDPAQYLRFADLRLRPGLDLARQIDIDEPETIIDLGCGAGHLTAILARRWPRARVIGVDASTAMLDEARSAHPALRFEQADLVQWRTDRPVDVIYSNAALHWLEDHDHVFPALFTQVRRGGVIAVQMPNNWREPTHTVPAAILDSTTWPDSARRALMRDRVGAIAAYRRRLSPSDFDSWETIYHHRLTGTDPVLEWVKGSLLRPVLDALDDRQRQRFERECADGYAGAYPPDEAGTTWLPFRRLFMVARRR
jgi:trans-aconitate 2-methyltransferase